MTNAADRGLLLLSGGIDSPVAGHLIGRAGWELDGIHFSLEPFTDSQPTRKAEQLAQILGLRRLNVVDAGPLFAQIPRRANPRYYFVLSKMLMLRTAESLSRHEGHAFLVTGENLGQVSSQTLAHLAAIAGATSIPVLRPLLGFDKSETIEIARRIGTYETSVGPEVCDVLGPQHPAVEASLARIREEAAKARLDDLVEEALCRIRVTPTPSV